MTPEGIALLVASFLGSTGIASFISSGAKFTRAARLRGAISATKRSLEGLDPNSSAYRATQVSITVMALEVASYALVRVPMRRRSLLILLALLLGMIIAIGLLSIAYMQSLYTEVNLDHLDSGIFGWQYFALITGMSIIYITFLAIVMSVQTSRHRERFVADALQRNAVDYELVVKHGSQLKMPPSNPKAKTPAPKVKAPDFSQINHFPEPSQMQKVEAETVKRPWWRFWGS